MKKVKYLLIFLMLLFGFIVPGELYQFYMNDFCDFYTETFYYNNSYFSKNEMLTNISDSARNHNVHVFLMHDNLENKFKRQITIYCNQSTKDYLENNNHICNGNKKSIFCGATEVKFCSFNDAPEKLVSNIKTKYYLIGELSDMRKMKSELADNYGGSFPTEDGFSQWGNVRNAFISIWIIIAVILCFISYYSIINCQREYVVKASMGESLRNLYFKTVVFDTIFIITVSFILITVLKIFTFPDFLITVSFFTILIFILLNCAINLRIFGFRIRAAFQNVVGKNEILIGNYLVKVISCMLTVVLLGTEFATIRECLKFYEQEDYFKAHKNYQYVNFIRTDKCFDNRDIVTEQFYRTFYMDMEYMDPLYNYNGRYIFFTSDTSLKWLRDWIPELENIDIKADINIFVSSGESLNDDDFHNLSDFSSSFFDESTNPDTEIIKYEKASVIAIEDNYLNKSEWINDPIIVMLSNQNFVPLDKESILNNEASFSVDQPRDYNCMIKASPEELTKFAESYGFNVEITNVYSFYLFKKAVIERTLYLCSILIILFIALEISVNILIIKTQYQLSAVELTLKKILGYSNFSRNKTIFITTFISTLIGTIISGIILASLGAVNLTSILLAFGITLVIEILVIFKYSRKYENESIQKILKGGI